MRFLIVRLDHAGDIVLTVPPVLHRLRQAHPQAVIDVLTTSTGRSLLRGDPRISGIVAFDAPWSVPPPGLRYAPKTYIARRLAQFAGLILRRRLRRYDAIICLSFSPWERLLTWPLARRRIGFVGPYRHRMHRLTARLLTDTTDFDCERHLVDNCTRLIAPVAGAAGAVAADAPGLSLSADDLERGRRLIAEATSGERRVVALHPGGPLSFKSWPHGSFVAVAESLAESGELDCVIVRSAAEAAEADAAGHARSAHPRVRYVVTRDMLEFAALAAGVHLVVANDGGAAHVAAQVGTAVAVIFGPTDDRIYRPLGPNVHVLRGPDTCAPCSTPWARSERCCGGKRCLAALTPAMVTGRVMDLLACETIRPGSPS